MEVRPIQALEIALFAERAAGPDRGYAPADPDEFLDWLDARWLDGRSAPGLCFVAETDHTTLASVVFWRRADMAHVEHMRGTEQACAALLAEAAPELSAQGIRRIWAEAVTPPTPHNRCTEVTRIFAAALMHELAPGVRLEIDADGIEAAPEEGLGYRAYDSLGKGAFVDALARCVSGTLDPEIARDIAELGERGAAAQRIERLLELDGERAWWQLAYSRDGDLAGMVLPSIAGGHMIGFVGVVPQWRGRGIATALVRRGAGTLAAAGATRIRSDVGSRNLPMLRAFEKAGFRRFATRLVWERTLPGSPDGGSPDGG